MVPSSHEGIACSVFVQCHCHESKQGSLSPWEGVAFQSPNTWDSKSLNELAESHWVREEARRGSQDRVCVHVGLYTAHSPVPPGTEPRELPLTLRLREG